VLAKLEFIVIVSGRVFALAIIDAALANELVAFQDAVAAKGAPPVIVPTK